MMKTQLRGTVKNSFEKNLSELLDLIQQTTDKIATSAFDESKMEEIAKYAREGATYIAVQRLTKEIIDDAMNEATPSIKEFTKALDGMIMDATRGAIIELIGERIAEIKDKPVQT